MPKSLKFLDRYWGAYMINNRASFLVGTGLVALVVAAVPAPVRAVVDEYSVAEGGEVAINLEVCSPESQLVVRGDTGTDLDFLVTGPTGETIHSDVGIDDYFIAVLEKTGNDCEIYNLGVSNLGEEVNNFTIVLEPLTESSTRLAKYIIEANATQTVDFRACGTSAQLTARGDGDTDLDFVVRNSDGAVVHEDDDLSDETEASLSGLLSDCETFEMDIVNLGEVYNAVVVMVEPAGVIGGEFSGIAPSTTLAAGLTGEKSIAEGSGPGEYRANANSSTVVNLPICGRQRLEVRGDGDTDLDFTVRDGAGDTVHSDFDLTDITFATLEAPEDCSTFTMEVENLGDVFNVFSVALTEAGPPAIFSGPGQYRVNAKEAATVNFDVCGRQRLSVRGDGDTDLDFVVTDNVGASVHSDFDLTDQTSAILETKEGCSAFSMEVDNLGDVFNVFTVSIEDAGPRAIYTGPGEYRAGANDSATVNFEVCGSRRLSVRGDGDTDLDFTVTNRNGDTVHSDFDLTDVTFATLNTKEGCETFSMEVDNLGDVYNLFTVELAELDANRGIAGPGQYRVNANRSTKIELRACSVTEVTARGDGDTDLDFDVNSEAGNQIHSNYDLTDVTSFTLEPTQGCENFAMSVSNLGEVYNVLTVEFDGSVSQDFALNDNPVRPAIAEDGPAIGFLPGRSGGDGNDRNISIINQTGEALNFIYWSNSATLEWGDDKLGDAYTLAEGQQWNVNVIDGSNACLFDFRAVTAGAREIELTRINVCEVVDVAFE